MTNGSDLDGGEGVSDGEEEVVEARLLLSQCVQLRLQAGLLVSGKRVHVISEQLLLLAVEVVLLVVEVELLVVKVELLVVEVKLLCEAELLLQAGDCILSLIEQQVPTRISNEI